MTILGLTIKNPTIGSEVYLAEVKQKLKEPNFISNPFNGSLFLLKRSGTEMLYLLIIRPIYPRIYYIGWVTAGVGVTFSLYWVAAIGGVMSATQYFWSRSFYKGLISISLKRRGFQEQVSLMDRDELEQEIRQAMNT